VGSNAGGADRSSDHRSDVLIRIRAIVPELTPSEHRVAQLALDEPTESAARTVTELAQAADTSQATVVRFAQRLGFGGYPALRLALAAAAAAEHASSVDTVPGTDISAHDDLATVVAKVANLDTSAVRDTVSQLDLSALAAVVDAVVTAPRLDVYGVGASTIVGMDLQMKLQRIGRFTQMWSDQHLALASAALLTRGDVAIGISHSGTTAETVNALQEARSQHATTVAVTNFPNSELAQVADLTLTTAVRETTMRSGAIGSRIAALTVVDCLFEAVAQRDVPATRRALQRTRDAVALRAHRLPGR